MYYVSKTMNFIIIVFFDNKRDILDMYSDAVTTFCNFLNLKKHHKLIENKLNFSSIFFLSELGPKRPTADIFGTTRAPDRAPVWEPPGTFPGREYGSS